MVAAYAAAGRMFVSRLQMSANVPTHVSSFHYDLLRLSNVQLMSGTLTYRE